MISYGHMIWLSIFLHKYMYIAIYMLAPKTHNKNYLLTKNNPMGPVSLCVCCFLIKYVGAYDVWQLKTVSVAIRVHFCRHAAAAALTLCIKTTTLGGNSIDMAIAAAFATSMAAGRLSHAFICLKQACTQVSEAYFRLTGTICSSNLATGKSNIWAPSLRPRSASKRLGPRPAD